MLNLLAGNYSLRSNFLINLEYQWRQVCGSSNAGYPDNPICYLIQLIFFSLLKKKQNQDLSRLLIGSKAHQRPLIFPDVLE